MDQTRHLRECGPCRAAAALWERDFPRGSRVPGRGAAAGCGPVQVAGCGRAPAVCQSSGDGQGPEPRCCYRLRLWQPEAPRLRFVLPVRLWGGLIERRRRPVRVYGIRRSPAAVGRGRGAARKLLRWMRGAHQGAGGSLRGVHGGADRGPERDVPAASGGAEMVEEATWRKQYAGSAGVGSCRLEPPASSLYTRGTFRGATAAHAGAGGCWRGPGRAKPRARLTPPPPPGRGRH